ncbi:putative sphingosine kinase [Planoprotostelium fungivorum]|uniref:Putative sphingosine kinase n=1 Tax=Planoprotostelium fungivorum TaxID=1890364 RepID=A0A2P6NMU4_9EUKA|nr:putative sphingosine kinase [Planoprotostelium fungivorum]
MSDAKKPKFRFQQKKSGDVSNRESTPSSAKKVETSAPCLSLSWEDVKDIEGEDHRMEFWKASEGVIQDIHLITPKGTKAVYEMSIRLSQNLDFSCGDAIGILPLNLPEEVEELSNRLNLDLKRTFTLSSNSSTKMKEHISHIISHRTVLTVEQLFLRWLDIRAVPNKSLLRVLATSCGDDSDREKLTHICSREGSDSYLSEIVLARASLLSVLRRYPSACPSLEQLVEHIPALTPRYYSIASSPGQIDVRIVFTKIIEPLSGICSSFLLGRSPLQSLQVFLRPSPSFHMDTDTDDPLILICAGTGIAPFLCHLRRIKREERKREERKRGTVWLFFGCTNAESEICGEEMRQMREDGVLDGYYISYSREGEREYVQDSISKRREEVTDLVERGARIFICGDANGLAVGVVRVLKEVLGQERVEEMKRGGKLQLDVPPIDVMLFRNEAITPHLGENGFSWSAPHNVHTEAHDIQHHERPVHIHFLSFEDMIGVEIHHKYPSCFVIYTFERPARSLRDGNTEVKRHLKTEKRRRGVYPFVCNDRPQAEMWIDRIKRALARTPSSEPLVPRKMIVLVNPNGGNGSAVKIWNNLQTMFEIASIEVQYIKTTHSGHATEVGQSLDYKNLEGIVCVSGDGLLYEVLNGIMSRRDWKQVMDKIVLGIIPGGSSNGLAATIGCSDPLLAAFSIIKGRSAPLDLFSCLHSRDKVSFGFLSVTYSIIADIDYDSEKYRFLGGTRQTVTAVFKMAKPTIAYPSKITYLLPENNVIVESNERLVDMEEGEWRGPHLTYINKEGFLPQVLPHCKTVEGDLTFFLASNVPRVGDDILLSPRGDMSDGYMDLIYGFNQSKMAMAKLLLGTADGNIEEVNGIEYHKVKAFVLDPLQERGTIMIDGEWAPPQKVCVEMHPGMGKLFVLEEQRYPSCSYAQEEGMTREGPRPESIVGSPGERMKHRKIADTLRRHRKTTII